MLKFKSNERRLYLQATGMTLLRVCSSVEHASFYEKKPLHKLPPLCFFSLHKDLFSAGC